MQLTHTLTVLGSFCFLLLEATTGFSGEGSPKIIEPKTSRIEVRLGEKLELGCKANVGDLDDFTLIYWLVNGTFPELTFTNGRIIEKEESASEEGRILQRSLVLKKVVPEDLKSTFTCVVTNTVGTDQRAITLTKSCRTRKQCAKMGKIL